MIGLFEEFGFVATTPHLHQRLRYVLAGDAIRKVEEYVGLIPMGVAIRKLLRQRVYPQLISLANVAITPRL